MDVGRVVGVTGAVDVALGLGVVLVVTAGVVEAAPAAEVAGEVEVAGAAGELVAATGAEGVFAVLA